MTRKAAASADPASDHTIVIQYAVTGRAGLPAANTLRRWAAAALAGPAELGIRLVEAAEMSALNRRFRGLNRATNVLAFPAGEQAAGRHGMLGDVVICVDTARTEARQQGKTLHVHLAHLLVHGVLHLRGHDHGEAAAAGRMQAEERRLLAGFGFDDPYIQT